MFLTQWNNINNNIRWNTKKKKVYEWRKNRQILRYMIWIAYLKISITYSTRHISKYNLSLWSYTVWENCYNIWTWHSYMINKVWIVEETQYLTNFKLIWNVLFGFEKKKVKTKQKYVLLQNSLEKSRHNQF